MTLSSLGDCALVVSLGDDTDDATFSAAAALAETIRRTAIDGVIDVVPAFASVTIYYDVQRIGGYARFESKVAQLATAASDSGRSKLARRTIEIPVCYGGEYGPDLEEVARQAGVGLDELIELHAAAEYRVEAIGFVPGFGYLGGLPRKLHTPRRATPRPMVAAGSVGIGGAQTGVYPVASPGGWNLIGRTPLVMFDATRNEPALLHAGDRVRFRPISPEEFKTWKSE